MNQAFFSSPAKKGFTLIEALVSLAILAMVFGIATPYLFGAREKTLLTGEGDRMIVALQTARQHSIQARLGYEYSVTLTPPGEFTIAPEGPTSRLANGIEISAPSTFTIIVFEKLTGKPVNPISITLTSKRFKTDITITSEGVISGSRPEKI